MERLDELVLAEFEGCVLTTAKLLAILREARPEQIFNANLDGDKRPIHNGLFEGKQDRKLVVLHPLDSSR